MGLKDLFKPAWQSENSDKSKKAVAKITDQQTLVRIAKEAPYYVARREAIEKLDERHQALFADIAKNDEESWVRRAAIAKLCDEEHLIIIAKNDKDSYEQIMAIEKLDDRNQALFAEIAKNDKDGSVRKVAVEKLNEHNQALFADIAKNDDYTVVADYVDTDTRIAVVCEAAVNKLTDMVLLADVTNNSKHSHIRRMAGKKIEKLKAIEESQYKASTFDEKKSLKLVSDYIDKNPMQKLSKEEMEMMKPFFAELFLWYKNNTEGKSLANECSRRGCRIYDDDLIFLSGSGKLFCKDCGLQYVINNLSDWYYYLGNITAGIGFVPMSIQKKGLELQEKMTVERESKKEKNTSN